MNFLDLINAVLTRLREDKIDETFLVSPDPYISVIGSHVNDAKDHVENAWDWSQLRGTDFLTVPQGDPIDPENDLYLQVQPGQVTVEFPDSNDNHYNLKRIFVRENGNFLRAYSIPQMRQRYAGVYVNPGNAPTGTPFAYSFADVNKTTGNQQCTLYPIPDKAYSLEIDRVKHQDPYVFRTGDPATDNWEDELKVPSLPVYSYATALASRERGEVGGTPVSELFRIADSHLSDAIALDSARFVEEMDWFSEEIAWHNTNVRNV